MRSATASDPTATYVDRKRHAWVLSLLVPVSVGLGPLLHAAWPTTLVLWLPVIFVHGVAPLIDFALGADASNPPEDAVPRLEADAYYRRVTDALVPLLWAAFVCAAWFCDDAPQLPNGYFGMFTIAYFPPLWFALMDARLVAAVHSDAARVNFHPRRRAALMRRHGLVDFPERAA